MANTKITSDNLDTLTTLTVDDITLDGSTISDAGDLTLDVGGDIILDAAGSDFLFQVGGTNLLKISNASLSTDFTQQQENTDIRFKGNDGGTTITALTLDMSNAGRAIFNENVGIGNSDPSSARLEVKGAKTQSGGAPIGNVLIADSTALAANVGGGITFQGVYHTGGNLTGLASIEAMKETATHNEYGGALVLKTREDQGSMNEAMRINSSGFVGFGTASPAALLHLSGNSDDGDEACQIVLNDEDSSAGSRLPSIQFKGNNTNIGRIRSTDTQGIIMSGSSAQEDDLVVQEGKVKIGNTGGSGILNVDNGSTDGGYVHFANNVGSTTLTNDKGLAFGWNKSNGGGESVIIANQGAGSSGGLVFATNTSVGSYAERMRITSAGIILGGTTTAPNYPGTITAARTGSSSTTNQATWSFVGTAGGSSKDFAYKATGSGSYAYGVLNAAETTWMSRLDFSGAIHLTNTTVQSISDRRLKKDIVDANSQWDDIKALQFKNFKWIDDSRGDGTYLGLIADEVESVSPGLVGIDAISAETMPEDGVDPEYKNVKYSILWMKATKALQESMARIETLEAKVEALENK